MGVVSISNDFVLFGAAHLLTLLVSTGFAVALFFWGCLARLKGFVGVSALLLAIILVGLEAFRIWQGYTRFDEPWHELLPLHLCRIASYICALMLLVRNYRLFEVAYFWGIGGSIAAMVTPDLDFTFPHPIFVGFFFGHTLVLSSVLFAIGAFEFKPRLRSIGFTAIATALYMGVVALVNVVLDTNYLYLCHKPEAITLYQYLGPWPWYIASVWLIGIVASFILYLPFVWLRPSRALR